MARPRTKGDGPYGECIDEFGRAFRTRKWMVRAAKSLRCRMTEAEEILWERLCSKKLRGLKFYNQKPIDRFVVDFYCPRLKLAIEVDGDIHNDLDQKEYDRLRTAMLREREIRVIRFRNDEILKDIDGVCERIASACYKKQ